MKSTSFKFPPKYFNIRNNLFNVSSQNYSTNIIWIDMINVNIYTLKRHTTAVQWNQFLDNLFVWLNKFLSQCKLFQIFRKRWPSPYFLNKNFLLSNILLFPLAYISCCNCHFRRVCQKTEIRRPKDLFNKKRNCKLYKKALFIAACLNHSLP